MEYVTHSLDDSDAAGANRSGGSREVLRRQPGPVREAGIAGAAYIDHRRARRGSGRKAESAAPRRTRSTASCRKSRSDFPELAKQHSQDPGSAAKGGDLGFITRGAMKEVPNSKTALFKLKEGEISAPVETKLGFHIIQATEVRGARGKSLEEMRPQIEAELKKQAAGRMFAETAEKFNNTVYEQSESLKPAAELVEGAASAERLDHARARGRAAAEQSQAAAGGILRGRAEEQAQHGSHRSRARHARCGAPDRAQAGDDPGRSSRCRPRSRRSSFCAKPPGLPRRKGRPSSSS